MMRHPKATLDLIRNCVSQHVVVGSLFDERSGVCSLIYSKQEQDEISL